MARGRVWVDAYTSKEGRRTAPNVFSSWPFQTQKFYFQKLFHSFRMPFILLYLPNFTIIEDHFYKSSPLWRLLGWSPAQLVTPAVLL